MSRTAEEWEKNFAGCWSLEQTERNVPLIIADLAACEKERGEERAAHDRAVARAEKAEAERDEALRDVEQLHDAAMETEDKLDALKDANADLSLRLEQMRGALVSIRCWYEDDADRYSWPEDDINSALSAPPGELAREVREVLAHVAEFMHKAQGNHTVKWAVAEEVDALLAKMGGEG
jgi:hypothetical protein